MSNQDTRTTILAVAALALAAGTVGLLLLAYGQKPGEERPMLTALGAFGEVGVIACSLNYKDAAGIVEQRLSNLSRGQIAGKDKAIGFVDKDGAYLIESARLDGDGCSLHVIASLDGEAQATAHEAMQVIRSAIEEAESAQ